MQNRESKRFVISSKLAGLRSTRQTSLIFLALKFTTASNMILMPSSFGNENTPVEIGGNEMHFGASAGTSCSAAIRLLVYALCSCLL